VRDIGCNILRCWGGNVYEDHKFFDFCDRDGIMVWQDFAMACALYPETDEFMQNMKTEVTSVIRKLRNHPSIIIWAGDNEVDACFPQYDPNANRITRQLISDCVRDNDIGRPYLPSSPYISKAM
jgi:beta-mannosidase